mgnify:CR=1 FL=1
MQGSIHGRAADRRALLPLQPLVERVCGEVLVRVERELKDPVTLRRELEAL